MPVERSSEASIKASEVANRYAQRFDFSVHVLGWHAQTGGLLEDFGVVDCANGRIIAGRFPGNDLPTWFGR